MTNTILKKMKCKRAKWLSEKALKTVEKRREVKAKGKGKDICNLMQSSRKSKGDKKDFLSEQCKEIEENSRLGKTRNLFKKVGDTKGTFHEKIGTIKDKNSKGLTEEKILRKSGKNIQKNCTKKFLMTQILTMV